jgi:hypothetical protein
VASVLPSLLYNLVRFEHQLGAPLTLKFSQSLSRHDFILYPGPFPRSVSPGVHTPRTVFLYSLQFTLLCCLRSRGTSSSAQLSTAPSANLTDDNQPVTPQPPPSIRKHVDRGSRNRALAMRRTRVPPGYSEADGDCLQAVGTGQHPHSAPDPTVDSAANVRVLTHICNISY